ncbi:polysaccharide deacetylase family protein [Actinoplanes sp. NPDC049599]|uniref:polysaccharide deacetylase family protein n=1 Tax=Actinoplanes sp. NPDC049599 TaxID=3363903 RepID=UPI0037A0E011
MRIPKSRSHRRSAILAGLLVPGLFLATAASAYTRNAQVAVTSETLVSLTFDDGIQDQYDNARPLLNDRGMKGTFYINSSRIGTGNYMSGQAITQLAADGHEIGGHTIDHADLPTLAPDDQKRTICNDRVALLNLGFAVRNFAYPFGNTDASARQAVADCGYNSARTVGGVVSPGSCSGCPYAETVPPVDAFRTATPDSVKTTTTLNTLKASVTNAEQNGGGWVALVLHHVCDGCGDEYAVSPALLGSFLDWLADRRSAGTRVVTVDEVIGGTTQPGVAGPVQPPAPDGNLVRNYSLESATSNKTPVCFQLGGFGTNTFSWARVTDAHTGTYAQQVTVTAHTSGDRKLVTKQDTGDVCSVPAAAGRTYKISSWYRGSWPAASQVRITLYHRNAAGAWIYWTSAPVLPAAGGWAKTPVYTTPALPAGSTALSFGVAIAGVGTLVVDDYSVQDTAA